MRYPPLLWPGPERAIGDVVKERGALWERLMRPFLLAALNTEPEEFSAALAGAVLRETLAKGGRFYRPRIAHPTLAAAFVDPALRFLESKKADVRLGIRLRGMTMTRSPCDGAGNGRGVRPVDPADAVVLAVPPWAAGDLVPDLSCARRIPRHRQRPFQDCPPAGSPPCWA